MTPNPFIERTSSGGLRPLPEYRSSQTLSDRFSPTPMAAVGRQDSSAGGSLREANLQRRLSGDESGEVSVAPDPMRSSEALESSRPARALRSSPPAACSVSRLH